MPKKPIYQELAFNPPKSEQTLQEWLFRELRSAIFDSRLPPGARLPSSRYLALGNRLSRAEGTSFRSSTARQAAEGVQDPSVVENLKSPRSRMVDGRLPQKSP